MNTSPAVDSAIERLTRLELLLQEEFAALRDRKSETIQSLSEVKQALVDEINASFIQHGDEIEQCINDKASIKSGELQKLIRSCAKLNTTNGCAIESSQSFTTALLDVLRGRIPGERTYTANGRLGLADRPDSAGFIRV
ncbi:MAG: flagellar biosynthesis/type III secretory pathway chaperone [Gammaproteobacteria bacterium]|jgi:flagellar biosynthesis/type III secretory pathway chaperone